MAYRMEFYYFDMHIMMLYHNFVVSIVTKLVYYSA
uniref:Uncharacterized protein n=1 Tax=Arundo donax TaxID=35708 RepID=A0A0A9HIY1_ARUDO